MGRKSTSGRAANQARLAGSRAAVLCAKKPRSRVASPCLRAYSTAGEASKNSVRAARQRRWAAGRETAMLTVILFSVWKNMGYYMVIYLAGLQGTNLELNEAAELDGANKWQIFWNVTLPQLRPTTFFVVIMLTINSFKVYDQMYMITQGGPGNATMTLVYDIYNVAFVNTPRYGYASAISMVLFVLVLIVTIVQFKGSSND